MPPLAIALVAAAAIAHAVWNVQIKRAGARGPWFLWLSFVVGFAVFLPFGVWSLVASGVDPLHWLWLAAVSGALQIAYFLLLQKSYSLGDVSLIYPVARGSGPLIAIILAVLVLGERPSPLGLVGAGVVIFGVLITGLAGLNAGTPVNTSGILLGLAVGAMIALYTLWDGAAVTVGSMPAVGLFWGSLLFQVAIMGPFALRQRGDLVVAAKTQWRAILTVGVLSPAAYILVLLAIQLAPISSIAPAREVSVVLVSIAGWWLLGEQHPAQRLLGAGVVLAGIGLIAVS